MINDLGLQTLKKIMALHYSYNNKSHYSDP